MSTNIGFSGFSVNANWDNQIQGLSSGMKGMDRSQLASQISQVFTDFGKLFDQVGKFVDLLQQRAPDSCQCGCVGRPNPNDSCMPPGSLQKDGESITTPGGYKITQQGQFSWQITGPDGASTKVWGDPHVAESDGGKWDFKRDSTFSLPDGTRINVNTKPYNDMTVTSQLEVINGNDRVVVSDIDKGKGKVGDISHDGLLRTWTDTTKRDDFVMGKQADDWTLGGHEIVGSEKGGEVLKVGARMEPGIAQMNRQGGPSEWANKLFDAIRESLSQMTQPRNPLSDFGTRGFGGLTDSSGFGDQNNLRALSDGLHAIAHMFEAMGEMVDMANQLDQGRMGRLVM